MTANKMEHVKLTNTLGMEVSLANVGARITSIKIPHNGQLLEMTVTPEDSALKQLEPFYLGATCGPVCNRIANASFELNGQSYKLSNNDGNNCLHGGENNISMQSWQVIERDQTQVLFALKLAHLADGFPGNRELLIHYRLSDDNALSIELKATTDIATPINLTNHAYFNLGDESTRNLLFKLNSEAFLERDQTGIPTGRFIDVLDTGFNTRNWLSIGEFVATNKYQQIVAEKGVDHCFLVANNNLAKAQLWSINTGICLSVYSDQPAIQFYTGKFLSAPYKPYQGVCFEAQGLTDAVNKAHFDADIVTADEPYARFICYQFSCIG